MKTKTLIIIIILSLILATAILYPKKDTEVRVKAEVGIEAPHIELKYNDGRAFLLSEQKGSIILINFWATWCQGCTEEMPSLQNLYNIMRKDSQFRIITILYRDSPQNASTYLNLRYKNFNLPFLIDPNETGARAYGVRGVPETFIIDKKGILRKKIIGPVEFDSPYAISFFKDLLNE